jgi:hypothetical protein
LKNAVLTNEAAANGWRKITLRYTTETATNPLLDLVLPNSAGHSLWTPTGTEQLFVWGAFFDLASSTPLPTPSPMITPSPTPTPTPSPTGTQTPASWVNPIIHSAGTAHVSINGSDSTGDGSSAKPWRTIKLALSRVAGLAGGRTIQIGAGTFVEAGPLMVPEKVSLVGSGPTTLIRAQPSLYFSGAMHPYRTDLALIQLKSGGMTGGNQQVRDLALDGDNKQVVIGVFVNNRNNVLISGVQTTNFGLTAVWFWETTDVRYTNSIVRNSARGDGGGSSGAVSVWRTKRAEFDRLDIDESVGGAIKSGGYGSGNAAYLHAIKIHDSRISVAPMGTWINPTTGTPAPNLAIEFWNPEMQDCEIYNNYIDNTISLAMDQDPVWNTKLGRSRMRVHHNTIDLLSRAKGSGYAVEVTMSDLEIDGNHIIGGALNNFDSPNHNTAVENFGNQKIHHNVFSSMKGGYWPTTLYMSRAHMDGVQFVNNTIEFIGDRTIHLFGFSGGNVVRNFTVKNNLVLNGVTGAPWGAPMLAEITTGSSVQNFLAENNWVQNAGTYAMNFSAPGATVRDTLTGDPRILRTGARPSPYFLPAAGSPLVDTGDLVGLPYSGAAPDIGALE